MGNTISSKGPVEFQIMDINDFITTHKLKEVTSIFIMEPSTESFHPDGLYSIRIFGELTSPTRMTTNAFINLNTRVFHPHEYHAIISLKRLYEGIMAGTRWATFNKEQGDFLPAKEGDENAGTGYAFFVKHFMELLRRAKRTKSLDKAPIENNPTESTIDDFLSVDQEGNVLDKETDSLSRKDLLSLLSQYRNRLLIDKFIVLPAGVRDYRVDASGRPKIEEINDLYVSLLRLSNGIEPNYGETPLYDKLRYAIQKKVVEIHQYIFNIIGKANGGKNGFVQRKWASRNIMHSGRGVITASVSEASSIDDPRLHHVTETKTPLFYTSKLYAPIVKYHLKRLFLSQIFGQDVAHIAVIDSNTYKFKFIEFTTAIRNKWYDTDGLDKFLLLMGAREYRNYPVSIAVKGKDYLLYLVYKDDKYVIPFRNMETVEKFVTEQLNREFNKDNVTPLTHAEMLYISTHFAANGKPLILSRHPITGEDSTYVSRVHLITTENSQQLTFIMPSISPEEYILPSYPVLTSHYIDSISPHPTRLSGLGGDHDGDHVPTYSVMTEEAVAEAEKYLHSIGSVIDPNGHLRIGVNTDDLKIVLQAIMDPVKIKVA